jgi:hypothetical protein
MEKVASTQPLTDEFIRSSLLEGVATTLSSPFIGKTAAETESLVQVIKRAFVVRREKRATQIRPMVAQAISA